MTPIQLLCTPLIMLVFVALLIAIFETLDCIDKGEYKKAIYSVIVCVILTIIVFAGILIAF